MDRRNRKSDSCKLGGFKLKDRFADSLLVKHREGFVVYWARSRSRMGLVVVVIAKITLADDFIDHLATIATEGFVIVDKLFIVATLAAMVTAGFFLNHAVIYLRT